MYGHLDKQPPLQEGWMIDKGPYKPVLEGDYLYGRGSSDDGYAFFSSVLIIQALQKHAQNIPNITFIFETDEESGSKDILKIMEKNKILFPQPDLIFCLDSGCLDYDHVYLTNSLRGICNFKLKAEVLKEGVHSGNGSGYIPDSFRVLWELLNNFEDSKTGWLPENLYVNVPQEKYQLAMTLYEQKKYQIDFDFPMAEGVNYMHEDSFKNYMNRIWEPTLTYIGADGIPSCQHAGNVLRPKTILGMSLRLPPTLEPKIVEQTLLKYFKEALKVCNANVELEIIQAKQGYCAQKLSANIEVKLNQFSEEIFGNPVLQMGEGGSIPLINSLQEMFPKADLLVTGVLGPKSNAHSVNECLNVKFMTKLVQVFANLLANL